MLFTTSVIWTILNSLCTAISVYMTSITLCFLSKQSVAYKSTSPGHRGNGWKTIPYEEIKVKNGHGYIIEDYIYSKDMATQKGVMYLRCQTPKRMKCKGRAVIANDKVKITRWHNHSPPDLQRLREQELLLMSPPIVASIDALDLQQDSLLPSSPPPIIAVDTVDQGQTESTKVDGVAAYLA